MNWLDVILAILLISAAFLGFMQGLIRALLSLTGILVGVVLASNFYQPLSGLLGFIPNERAANIIAFILILAIVLVITALLAKLLTAVVSGATLGWINRLGGALFGVLLGAIFLGALLAVWVEFFGAGVVTESLLAGVLLDKFPLVLALLPSEFDSIRKFFSNSQSTLMILR